MGRRPTKKNYVNQQKYAKLLILDVLINSSQNIETNSKSFLGKSALEILSIVIILISRCVCMCVCVYVCEICSFSYVTGKLKL